MPYTIEHKKGKGYKLHLKDDYNHIFSNEYQPKKKVIKQMQAIEISKKNKNVSGGGIRDLFNKVKNTVSSVVSNVSSLPTNIINKALPEQQKYTRKADLMLKRYGHFKIEQLFVERQEVDNAVMKLANVLTINELNSAMKKNNVDTFYHLNLKALITTATGQNIEILIEKNETINIDIWKQKPETQSIEIDLLGKVMTIKGMLEKTRLTIGNEKFFLYRALDGQNCGDFCTDVLKSNGLWQEKYNNFMNQRSDLMKKHISTNSQNRLNMITKLGSLVRHIKGGKLEDNEIRFI